MGLKIAISASLVALCLSAPARANELTQNVAQHCGWISMPSPQNMYLIDKSGEWIISEMGGHQSEGDWPELSRKKSHWVSSGTGGYGYGCACFKMQIQNDSKNVIKVTNVLAKKISACRNDRNLRRSEPLQNK